MLSFLRETNFGNLPADEATSDAKQKSNVQSQEQEYFTVASHGRAVRKSTTLLAVLFLIGLLGLWLMIKKSAPKAASAADVNTEETQIETAIARLTGIKSEMFSSMDEIVSKFYEFSNVMQVQVSELVKNPFQLELFLSSLKSKSDVDEENIEIDAEMIWQEQIKQKAKDMQLDSVMQSDQGKCCMINNKILYVGDSIADFTVEQINDSLVKLKSGTVEIVLSLSK
jgi:preprotein translocase subunit SecG